MRVFTFALCLLLAGCGLPLRPEPPKRLFTLAPVLDIERAGEGGGVLLIAPLRAQPALDTEAMAYRTSPYTLDYYAKSRWVARPAQLLLPFLVEALEETGAFRAVISMPAPVSGDFRLEVALWAFHHELMEGSRGVVILRAALYDRQGRVKVHRFASQVPSRGEDPYSGVVAINQALEALLPDLAVWAAQAARSFAPP